MTGRRATSARTSVARLKAITFVRPVPAKRSRASRTQNVDVKELISADEDYLGIFEFGNSQPRSGRLMRRSPRKLVNYLESYAIPPVEPLEVRGSSAGDSDELRGAAGDSRSRDHSSVVPVVPSPASAAKGFDMSLFQKPGEWKCETCLVKNPPGGDQCVSCETPTPGGVQAGGATAASGSGSSGFFANSTVEGALFASSAPTIPSFTFGVQAAENSPAAKGFDMSLFQKPGEWKCETCLVKNPPGGDQCVSCEAPKPGGVQAGGATAASVSGSSGFFAGSTAGCALFASSAPTIPSFTFGVQAAGNSPAAKGLDVSLFQKPGEWKCETCLVKNPPGGDQCVSCETPKPGGVQAGGATAASGSGSSGFLAGSTAGSALFAPCAPTISSFTCGVQAAGNSPAAKGFDMSLFQKPGEWKCETCLVKNPPGGDQCVSCETPNSGGVQAGGATAASGSGSSGFFAGSIAGGALFASSAPTIPSFTFGVQAAGNSPAAKGFDMALFQKPGEWKCETCLVKKPPGGDQCVLCETPKPGGVQAGGATAASGSGSSGFFAGSTVGCALFASSAPTIPSFTFGVQTGVVSGGGSFGEAQKNGASTGASPGMTKGFDMSLFVKPGEWKCDACLVRECSRC